MKRLTSITALSFGISVAFGNISFESLPPGARLEGETLIVEIPANDSPGKIHCESPIDLSPALAGGRGVALAIRVRAFGVTEPDRPWNGVKAMLRYVEEGSGATQWPGAGLLSGTYDWTNATVRINPLIAPDPPAGGMATLILGLEGCTGRAEFDLSSLSVVSEDCGIPLVNEDYVVPYPGDDCPQIFNVHQSSMSTNAGKSRQTNLLTPNGVREEVSRVNGEQIRVLGNDCDLRLVNNDHWKFVNSQPRRGCMLPGRDTTEDDITTLAAWGATLVRFQINRNWRQPNDNQDLSEYGAWIDSRLDNLADVLSWCGERGMKVCVDLHAPPGGKRPGDLAMNMFFEERWADAFVETWRRIATRFHGHPAIYGYDLVNEPDQRGPAPISYWEIQRRAAEAVRAIDPDTSIIVESNLADSPAAFRYLSPLAMDNVIYQVHVYAPMAFTHQGVYGRRRSSGPDDLCWPGTYGTEIWDRDFLRRVLAPVREFQKRHGARIYVGEFSAAAWAPGAGNYLRDCIGLFEEYGWDWTYHAFREAPVWDVEKEAFPDDSCIPASADTPRKRALLEGLSGKAAGRAIRQPDDSCGNGGNALN